MQSKFVVCGLILCSLFVFNACGGSTQMSASNRELLAALQTAVSSKKSEWLESVAKRATDKTEKKEMSVAEFNAIDAIVKKARAGDWKGAQQDSFRLSEGQRPTSQDLSALKEQQKSQSSTKK